MKKQAKILKVIFMGLLIASTAIISSCKKDAETKPVNFDGKTYEKSNLTMYWDETYNNNTDTNSQVGYGKKIISYTKLSDSEFEVYYYNEKDKHTGEGDQWDNVHSKITGKVIIKMVEDNYDVQIVQYDKTVDFDDEKESDQKISLSDLDENGKKQVLVDIFGYSDRKSLFEEQTRVFITDGRAKFSFVDEEKVEISHLYSEYPNEFTCSIDKGKKTIQVNNLSSSTKPDEFTYSSNGKEIYYKNIIEDKSTPIDSVNYIKYNVTTYKLK